VTGVAAGVATIYYVVTNSCGADSAAKAITVLSTECAEGAPLYKSPGYGIRLFPNPASGPFYLVVSSPLNEEAHIIISNVVGTKIEELWRPVNTEILLNLNAGAGIYILSVHTATGVFNSRLIVR
jgi:hypothetical protein